MAGVLALICGGPAVADVGAISNVLISRSGQTATVEVRFTCPNRYLENLAPPSADHAELNLSRLGRCDSTIAAGPVRETTRPAGRDMAALDEIEYLARDGTEATLLLRFDRPVKVTPVQTADLRALRVLVEVPEGSVKSPVRAASPTPAAAAAGAAPPSAERRARADVAARERMARPPPIVATPRGAFAINLESATEPISVSAAAAPIAAQGQQLYVVNMISDSQTWYQLRLGFFASEHDAAAVVKNLQLRYPQAWVVYVAPAEHTLAATQSPPVSKDSAPAFSGGIVPAAVRTLSDQQIAALMEEAHAAMLANKYNQAIELYTRVLREPAHESSQEAQELLGLARERDGQMAYAVAEYRHYLAVYQDGEGAERVQQRLAALTTARDVPKQSLRTARPGRDDGNWDSHGSFSQYYRRDTSDFGGQGGSITQSAVLSDGDFRARYHGERFDFSTRTTAGYRFNINDAGWSTGNQSRFYNLYLDLQDHEWGLGGRLGRQTLRTGGVLGLFDGAHLSWQVQPDIRLNFNTGYPVYSSADGVNTDRVFYGGSVDFTHLLGRVDASVFYNTQDIHGVQDRQAVGGEVRYLDEHRSLLGAVDYDIGYGTLNTLNLIGNWSFDSGLAISASADYRRSPVLTTDNALIGQTAGTIDSLLLTLTEDQIRRLALDRSGKMLTYSFGFSRPLAQRWQINGDFTVTQLAEGPGSGGVLALPDSGTEYYVYTSLVGSSLFTEGDVSILGLRYSDSYATRTSTVYLDSRYPVTSALRLNPRLALSLRQISADNSSEWLLTPSLRLLYRFAHHYQIELEGGSDLGSRTGGVANTDTTAYFIYVGYRADF